MYAIGGSAGTSAVEADSGGVMGVGFAGCFVGHAGCRYVVGGAVSGGIVEGKSLA